MIQSITAVYPYGVVAVMLTFMVVLGGLSLENALRGRRN